MVRAAVLYTAGPWFEPRLPYHPNRCPRETLIRGAPRPSGVGPAQTTACTMRMIRSRRSESNERWAGNETSHGPT